MKEIVIRELKKHFTLKSKDMGDYKTIKKGLFHFECENYEIENVGNLFFIKLNAMLGLMKMETAVITPIYKDASFGNIDIVKAMGNDTYIMEMYDTALHQEDLSGFDYLKTKYGIIREYDSQPRWYDELRLSSTISKKGRNISKQADALMLEWLQQYIKLLLNAEACDPEEKIKRNKKYSDRLISEGGMAVDSLTKMIGAEKTATLIRKYMYATED